MASSLLIQEETSLALEIIPENVKIGEELASAIAPSHGGAGRGSWGEPRLHLVVGLCNPASLQRTERGWCGAIFTFIL